MNNLGLRVKLISAFLLVGLLPFIVISVFSLKKSESGLKNSVEKKLSSVSEVKAEAFRDFMHGMRNQAITFSRSTMIVDAMKGFKPAFTKYKDDLNGVSLDAQKTDLWNYYENHFAKQYQESNNGSEPPSLKTIFNMLDKESLALQYAYISNNPNPLGSKHLMDAADNDSSEYAALHSRYHPPIRHFLEMNGYYDIFLVDPDTGDIIYSVYKELDYSTSLIDGPYAKTNFAEAFRKANAAKESDYVYMTDLEPYFPSYEAAAGFVSSPIFDQGKKIGVLIMQIPVAKIDQIMTNHNQWKETGMGDTGETYIIGKDQKLRSNLRLMIEDMDSYIDILTKEGLDSKSINLIKSQGTSVIRKPINTEGAMSAIKGEKIVRLYSGYYNDRVVGATVPLNLPDLEWFIVAEESEDEAYKELKELKTIILVVFIIGIIFVAFIGVFFGQTISSSLISIMKNIFSGAEEVTSASHQLSTSSQRLSQGATEQAASLEETSASLDEMASMTKANADNAGEANKVAEEAKNAAERGDQAMHELQSAMSGIADSSSEVSKIIKTIEEIAFQTNLLALNAAVEAARAGEHGKGFAVVADEVRNLAQRASEAAKNTESLIQDSVRCTQEGVEISTKAGDVLTEIISGSKKVVEIVSEIASASKEQADGISQITNAISQMDQVTQQNAANAEESAATSEELSAQAETLRDAVRKMQKLVLGESGNDGLTAIEDQYDQNKLGFSDSDGHGPKLMRPNDVV